MIVESRFYQQIMMAEVRTAYQAGVKSVLLVAPTGSGKTVMFSLIAQAAIARGTRTAIGVHRDTLLNQASRTLTDCGVPHGIIAPGHTATDDLVHVASIQTLVRRIERHEFDLLILDECHHALAGSWRKVIAGYPQALILGVTATPCRTDGRGLDGVFDKMVRGPSTAELIEMGYLVQPVVYAPRDRLDLTGVQTRGGDYVTKQLESAVDKPTITGCAVAHYQRLCPGAPAVAFCVSVQHSEDVAADFQAAGIRAAAIHGRMPLPQIQDTVEALRDGRIRVLTSCDLISEGFDCPHMQAVLLLRPTQSESLYIQMVGRGLRPSPGKTRAIILDHAGNCFKHGMPDADRDWTLEARKVTRTAGGQAGIAVRQCPKCYACHKPSPACPHCGHVYTAEGREIKQVDGELVQLSPEAFKRVVGRKIREVQSLAEMQQLARDLGYKSGWAWYAWKREEQRRRRELDQICN